MRARWTVRVLLGAGIAMLLVACAGKTVVESDLGLKDAPDWVNEGTNVLNDKGGRLFHGVGSAPVMGDDSMQQSTADNRARAELARILSSYMDVVGSDYLAASGGADAQAQFSVSQQIKSLSKVNVTGSRIIARWKDKKSKVVYSLAEVDMKGVKDTARTVQDLNDSLRQHIDSRGDNIFDQMMKGGK